MIITKLNIIAFGKFINKTISFTDGLNIIYGENEAGKSTTHAFIKAMFYGLKKKKGKLATDLFQKYYPWDSRNTYGGTLTFIYNNSTYQIYREFSITNPLLEIKNLSDSGNKVEDPELFLNKVMHNISKETYDNTISIKQLKSAQDSSIVDELHKIIANLNTSGDISIDTLYALNYLNHKKETIQKGIDDNASILYNRQLGNIRNLEKELASQKYDNKLAEIITKKNDEEKKIHENNEEIESLKQDIAEKTLLLNQYGISSGKDIENLSSEASKIYLDYKPVINKKNDNLGLISNIAFIILGIVMIVFSSVLLMATYPPIADKLKLYDTRYTMNFITNFVINLPFHPIILIALLICVGLILLFGNIIIFISDLRSRSLSAELHSILSDILNQQIGSDEVSDENMQKFKKHIREMRAISKVITDFETKIVVLTEENNDLLKKQAEYINIIKSQQKIQSDVEQKYNELYTLRLENEKTKHILEKNDRINNDVESINLAIETINTLSSEIKVSFGTHLNKTASKYMSLLTNNKYNSLNVGNAMSVTINYEGRFVPLSQTSAGTIDQIYLSLRLAIADIINSNQNILPLIFDDCFAMYDNNRLKSTLEFLSNHDSQTLVFTCHTREINICINSGIKSNLLSI